MAEYMGKDGFVWWQGVVEDRYDPLYLGRCRIRILGWHTEDKADMPTESLPWAYPIQPILSAAQTGVGISPTGPVEGTWVVGFYRDGMQGQEPVFFGTLGGIPSAESKIPSNEGFSDPRGDTGGPVHPLLAPLKKYAPISALTFNAEDPAKNIPYPPLEITHYKSQTDANTALDVTGKFRKNLTTFLRFFLSISIKQTGLFLRKRRNRDSEKTWDFLFHQLKKRPKLFHQLNLLYGN